ncbi:MAG: translation elongation factor Ts [Candidatus Hydrogenedentota bacterium]|nr:MAG: translation elongation factor Ts [Candidatus Hydrogenedentota bacterium]
MTMDAAKIKQLRDMTSAGMLDCKKALEEAGGDLEKAAEILRKKGIAKAVKKMGREAAEGGIFAYIHHNNKLGVLLELNCETDFVARNEKFQELGKNIAMHIAASNPQYIKAEDVPEDVIEKEKALQRENLIAEGKPEDKLDKILEGKIRKFLSEITLLGQPYVKEPKMTVEDLIKESITTLGENISVKRFTRYEI